MLLSSCCIPVLRLQARAEAALRRLGANSVEAATEWLLLHPEDAAAGAAAAGAAGVGSGGSWGVRI